MPTPSPESHPIREFIQRMREDNRPISKWAATSLTEIYLEDSFALGRIKGGQNPDLKYSPGGIRIIAIHDNRFAGLVVNLSAASDEEALSAARDLRRELNTLPNLGQIDQMTSRLMSETLTANNKQVVAALEIGVDGRRNAVVHVLYPKLLIVTVRELFSSLGVNLPDLSQRQAAFGIAVKFLKSVPFSSSEPRLLTPENSEG